MIQRTMPDRALAEGPVRLDALFRQRLKIPLHRHALRTSRVEDHTWGTFFERRFQIFRRHRKSGNKFGTADDWREVLLPKAPRIRLFAIEEKESRIACHDADRE